MKKGGTPFFSVAARPTPRGVDFDPGVFRVLSAHHLDLDHDRPQQRQQTTADRQHGATLAPSPHHRHHHDHDHAHQSITVQPLHRHHDDDHDHANTTDCRFCQRTASRHHHARRRQHHDGGRRSRHVSDPQPAGGWRPPVPCRRKYGHVTDG